MQVRGRASLAIFMAASIVLLAVVPYNAMGAADETRYELTADELTFGNDLIISGLDQTVFHQMSAAARDNEALTVSFPGALVFSPSQGTNIPLPSISQASEEAVSVSSTGFFHADLPFYPCCNFGAAPVGVGQFGKPSPVTPARLRGSALMYPEMINKDILNPNLTYENKNLNNTMVTLPPLLASGPYSEVAAVANVTIGETAANNSSLGNITPPLLLSSHRFNFDSGAQQINNYSIVERMWRNSHLAHLMDIAYEGESSRPYWMAPLKPAETLQLTNHFKVLGYALNLTKPGKYLTKAGWDLEPLTPGKL
jgi:hypothetical protein